jgi:CRP/FNR family transcriptional regulator
MQILKIDLDEKMKTLRANPYFEGLADVSLQELAEHTSLRQFERGEALFWEGDPGQGLHIVYTGCLKLFRVSPAGRQYIVRIVQENDTFSEVPAFDGHASPVNVEALEESRVWVVESQAVRALMEKDPVFQRRIIENLAGMLRHMIGLVSEMAFYQVTHRLARLIRAIPPEELRGEKSVRWTQDQLAARLGTVREVVARSLKELERSGAIEIQNRRIEIADAEALAQWTEGPWN